MFLNFCCTKIWPCFKIKQDTLCPLCSYCHTIIVHAFYETRYGKIYVESKVDHGIEEPPYPQSVTFCYRNTLLIPAHTACCIVINSSQWCLIFMDANSGMHLWRREFSPILDVIFNCRHLVLHPFCSN